MPPARALCWSVSPTLSNLTMEQHLWKYLSSLHVKLMSCSSHLMTVSRSWVAVGMAHLILECRDTQGRSWVTLTGAHCPRWTTWHTNVVMCFLGAQTQVTYNGGPAYEGYNSAPYYYYGQQPGRRPSQNLHAACRAPYPDAMIAGPSNAESDSYSNRAAMQNPAKHTHAGEDDE